MMPGPSEGGGVEMRLHTGNVDAFVRFHEYNLSPVLVICEVKPARIEESLPPSLKIKKYGAS